MKSVKNSLKNNFLNSTLVCIFCVSCLSACMQVSETIIDGTAASTELDSLSEESQTALSEAKEVAEYSLASNVISRRYSKEAARGEVALLSTPDKKLPILASGSAEVEEIPSPSFAKNATVEKFTIDDAVKASLGFNLSVAKAAERLTRAELAKTNAVLGYFPRAQAVGEVIRVRQRVLDTDNAVFQAGEARFDATTGRVEVTQPLLDFGRIFATKVASVDVRVAETAYLAAAQRAAFETVSAYMSALEIQAQKTSINNRLSLLKKQLAAEDTAIQSGLVTSSARELVEIEIGRTEIEQLEIISLQSRTLADLGNLIGQPITSLEPVRVPRSVRKGVASGNANSFVEEALRNNPEMNRLRLVSLRQRKDFERQAAEDYAPYLEAFGTVSYEDQGDSRFGGGSRTLDNTVGVRLTVPIFNAKGLGYVSNEAQSDARTALLEEAGLHRSLETEIRSLHMEIAALKRLIVKSESAYASSKRLLADARRRVKSGFDVPIMVVRQQLQVERAREWVERSKYRFIRSWARFSYLTGRRFSL